MSNRSLAEKIADDLFGGNNGTKTKAKQLRLYTDFGDDGRYLASRAEGPMTDRIEDFMDAAALIPHQSATDALAALRKEILSLMTAPPKTPWQQHHDTGVMDALICFDTAFTALGLDAAVEAINSDGFWLESFQTRKGAENFIKRHSLPSAGLTAQPTTSSGPAPDAAPHSS